MIYLAFDLGLSHTGVAISHEGKLAQPLSTLNSFDQEKLLSRILSLINKYHPDTLLFGLPPAGPIVALAHSLKQQLESQLTLPIILHEEHRSSSQSQLLLKRTGATLAKRRRLDHAASAAYILQEYLDFVA